MILTCVCRYMIKKMGEDGACLFRAVADQLYGDEEMHQAVRTQCLDYIVSTTQPHCLTRGHRFMCCRLHLSDAIKTQIKTQIVGGITSLTS